MSCRDDFIRLKNLLTSIPMHVEQTERAPRLRCFLIVTLAVFLVILLFAGCAGRRAYSSRPKTIEKPLARLGYTIQVGAFSDVENAARLTDQLKARGFDATYFVARA